MTPPEPSSPAPGDPDWVEPPDSPLALAIGVEVAHLLADVQDRRDREAAEARIRDRTRRQ